jgi:hypothetical protein
MYGALIDDLIIIFYPVVNIFLVRQLLKLILESEVEEGE